MKGELPKGWAWEPIGPHVEERSESIASCSPEGRLRFDRLRGVTNKEGIVDPPFDRIRSLKDPSRYVVLRVGDFAYNPMRVNVGSIGLVRHEDQVGKISPDYVVFRCRPSLHPEYLFAWLKSSAGLAAIRGIAAGAVRQRLYFRDLARLKIPLPSLAEQARIVRVLAEADELRRLRREADRRTADLVPAIFHEMFGNGGAGSESWSITTLQSLVDVVSGATPSKSCSEYWGGTIPWVSPKDMKSAEIVDAEDHVSDRAVAATGLKMVAPHAVLVVVRGMILAHTVPIRINTVPVTINQDMKALVVHEGVDPVYLRWTLEAQHSLLLSRVSAAGHGTKKLDTPRLLGTELTAPPYPLQHAFASRVSEVRAFQAKQAESRSRLDELYESLLYRAFAGEL